MCSDAAIPAAGVCQGASARAGKNTHATAFEWPAVGSVAPAFSRALFAQLQLDALGTVAIVGGQ